MENKSENSNSKVSTKERLEELIKLYLASNPLIHNDGKVSEVEVRFGSNTKKYKPISKIDYDNVVKQLYAAGFKTDDKDGFHSLRIFHEYSDEKTGMSKMSNIRAEIVGLDLIQEYCNTNSIQKILDMPSSTYDKIHFTQKTRPKNKDNSNVMPVDFEDFNIRVSYQMEQSFTARSNIIRSIVNKWSDSKKTFRHMNRVRFYHPDLPVFADLSIVRNSKTSNRVPIKEYTIQDAGVFSSPETYEIEMELDNSRIGAGTMYNNEKSIVDVIRKSIRIILSGLQGTNYPISYIEKDQILHSYMKLIHGDEYQPGRIIPRDFIGPSSYTLQIENIVDQEKMKIQSNIPNIRKNYTVTDKADGERKLLFISGDGKIYMIDTNMNVIFTGMKTKNKDLFDSLIDGEHIKYDKNGKFINLYAGFDIYYIHKNSVREYAFYPTEAIDPQAKPVVKYRLNLLKQFIELIQPISILEDGSKSGCDFHIRCKTFYNDIENTSIFEACSRILSDVEDGVRFEYNTDGLIFTPSNTAVGSDTVGKAGPVTKNTWKQSFKWKPSEYNTIDFLVSVKKDKTGKDEIHNVFQNGQNLQSNQNILQYKTLILRCGFNERDHGYLNPFQDIIQNKLPSPEDLDNESAYKPVPFQPTNPYDPNACYANIKLHESENGNMIMVTEESEFFEEDMIVEFSYDMTKSEGWKWTPLRVRYDKTTELRNGMNNFGNAYHVANSNWQSIHSPITIDMITLGKNIPENIQECDDEEGDTANEGVYYNRTGDEKRTKSLRDFHNLYVKSKMILGVSSSKDTLIDYAVGKAGDLPKWIYSKLSFVFGIDISKDNIHNKLDGACARYLNYRKQYKNMPYCLFVNGNSGNNIRNSDAFLTEKDKQIGNAVFGNGKKDSIVLGEGVYKQYGVAHDGFNVSSCQFALHYFFENPTKLHGFLRNIAECTKLNGYFIGTCYDGKTVFKILKNKNMGESMTIMNGEKKMFELTKMYSETGFPDDEVSLGYSINVFQETINKTFREYLVNFDYFVRVMEDYGFVPISKDDAKSLGLPNGNGLFDELYHSMEAEIKQNTKAKSNYRNAHLMTADEKQISFMNRYFVFRKVRNINVEKIAKLILHKNVDELVVEPDKIVQSNDAAPIKIMVKKTKGKKVKITG